MRQEDPASLWWSCGWPRPPRRAAVAKCVNGKAGPYACKNVDLMAFLPHTTWGGGSGNDIWGWTDPSPTTSRRWWA